MTTVNPGRILLGALATVLEQRATLLRALAAPFALIVLIALAQPAEPTVGATLFLALTSLLLYAWFAITTHRIVLLGAEAVPRWGLNSWGLRETRFILSMLSLFFAGVFIGVLLAPIPLIGVFLAAAVVIVGVSALSLVFPAVAVDDPITFGGAWDLAKGHLVTLIICVFLFPFVLTMPLLLLVNLPLGAVLVSVLQGVVTVLTVTALSLAYSEIKRATTAPPPG